MLRKSIIAIAAGAALASAIPVQASTASDLVGQVAGSLQSLVGKQPGSDIAISAITAEGETLVVKVDGPKAWRANKTPAELSGLFVNGYCSKAAATFDTGMKLRVDTTEDGAQLWQGPTIDHCPKS